MEPIYRKVFIKSEADLPEKEGRYFVKIKGLPPEVIDIDIEYYSIRLNRGDKKNWINNIDWYLQPVELPSDEEIEKAGNEYSEECFAIEDFVAGMKLLRDKLINK